MKYDFSVNITVKELESMMAYAKSKEINCIGVHFKRGSILDAKNVSRTASGWKNFKSHIDVTDWESA